MGLETDMGSFVMLYTPMKEFAKTVVEISFERDLAPESPPLPSTGVNKGQFFS